MEYSDLAAAVRPDALRALLAERADELREAGHQHHLPGVASERRATHRGHEIVVRTTYEITVDGRPFDAHVVVDNAGSVMYHGLPTQDFPSVVDLVKQVIDQFPADFAAGDPAPGHCEGDGHDHDHHDHDHHDHAGGH